MDPLADRSNKMLFLTDFKKRGHSLFPCRCIFYPYSLISLRLMKTQIINFIGTIYYIFYTCSSSRSTVRLRKVSSSLKSKFACAKIYQFYKRSISNETRMTLTFKITNYSTDSDTSTNKLHLLLQSLTLTFFGHECRPVEMTCSPKRKIDGAELRRR